MPVAGGQQPQQGDALGRKPVFPLPELGHQFLEPGLWINHIDSLYVSTLYREPTSIEYITFDRARQVVTGFRSRQKTRSSPGMSGVAV